MRTIATRLLPNPHCLSSHAVHRIRHRPAVRWFRCYGCVRAGLPSAPAPDPTGTARLLLQRMVDPRRPRPSPRPRATGPVCDAPDCPSRVGDTAFARDVRPAGATLVGGRGRSASRCPRLPNSPTTRSAFRSATFLFGRSGGRRILGAPNGPAPATLRDHFARAPKQTLDQHLCPSTATRSSTCAARLAFERSEARATEPRIRPRWNLGRARPRTRRRPSGHRRNATCEHAAQPAPRNQHRVNGVPVIGHI